MIQSEEVHLGVSPFVSTFRLERISYEGKKRGKHWRRAKSAIYANGHLQINQM